MKIAIIGAGLSGLTAAHIIDRHFGKTVHLDIFDKSRGVSGRMSTRYAGDYEFDHGAQYFTAHNPVFQDMVIAAIEAGHVAPWPSRGVYQRPGAIEQDRGGDRFVAIPRMNSWVKAMAEGMAVTTSARVNGLRRLGKTWTLDFEGGLEKDGYAAVILSIPSPQACDLLPKKFSHLNAVEAAKMDACFALMIGFAHPLDLEWDTLRTNRGAAQWLAVNSAKPGRARSATLVVHAAPEWSNQYAEASRDWVQREMIAVASDVVGLDIRAAQHHALHRWLYASVSQTPDRACLVDEKYRLIVCGDWCLGGQVEGAALSGHAAGQAVLKFVI